MSGCSSQSVARLFVVALVGVLAACSDGSGGGGGGKASPETSPSTTAPPPSIDLSKPIPGGSLHSTPRPPLENTGTDYVAILKSITANFRWLTENPDVSLLQDLYAPGTETFAFQESFFSALNRRGLRGADEGYRLLSAEVIDAQPQTVSLRVSDEFSFERVVDSQGNQVGEGRARNPAVKNWNVALTSDSEGHWRVASWTEVSDTVQL